MKRHLLLFVLCVLSAASSAQPWSGILPSGRAVDWSVAGISGDIPSGSWAQCVTSQCATVSGGTVTTASVNAAITSAPNNTYVLLPTGAFTLSAGAAVQRSNVEIRGPTSGGITLNFSGACSSAGPGGLNANVCLSPAANNYFIGNSQVLAAGSNAASWSAGYAQGATSITVGTVGSATIANGQVIILDQANDGASNGTAGDTGGVFNCDRFTNAGSTDCKTESGNVDGRALSGGNGSQTQLVTVTAGCASPCTGAGPFTLTISPGLKATNWRSGQTPGAWWTDRISKVGLTCPTGPCVMNFAGNTTAAFGVVFNNVDNFWMTGWTVENVFSNNGSGIAGYNIAAYQASHGIVRSNYVFSGQDHSSNYGFYPFIASDVLVENNIFQQVAEPAMLEACSGCVIANNFSINDWYSVQNNWQQNSYAVHNTGGHMNLFEGNQFEGSIYADIVHGTADLDTLFRNRLTGRGYNGTSGLTTQNTPAINLEAFHRGFNIIGNVLGTSGYHTDYEVTSGTPGTCNTTIYELNYSGTICRTALHVPADTLVASTLFRWGNYDTVNAAVRWDNTESSPATAGSGATALAGASTPGSHTLPASFYLASRPSWWSTALPYPAIGPDVTGGTGPGGFSYDNPAGVCYSNVMGGTLDGTGNLLSYNQSACYPLPVPSDCPTVGSPLTQAGAPGPPNYGGLRIDCIPAVLGTVPNVWNNYTADYGFAMCSSPPCAGKTAVNAFGNTIVRVTDGNTDPSRIGRAYSVNYTGSDEDQHISLDGSMFGLAQQAGSANFMFCFNANCTAPVPRSGTVPMVDGGNPFQLPFKTMAASKVLRNTFYALNTGTSVVSANAGSGASIGGGDPWTFPSNIGSPTSYADVNTAASSQALDAETFGFSVSANPNPNIITANFQYYWTGGAVNSVISCQLLKAGLPFGSVIQVRLGAGGGGSSGSPLSAAINFPVGALVAADINNAAFGLQFFALAGSSPTHVFVRADNFKISTVQSAIQKYDLGRCTSTNCHVGSGTGTYDAPVTVYDWSQGSCLYGLASTATTVFRVSDDDKIFSLGFSFNGGQNTATLAAAVHCDGSGNANSCTGTGNGCRVWNTCPAAGVGTAGATCFRGTQKVGDTPTCTNLPCQNASATPGTSFNCTAPGCFVPPGDTFGTIPASNVVGEWNPANTGLACQLNGTNPTASGDCAVPGPIRATCLGGGPNCGPDGFKVHEVFNSRKGLFSRVSLGGPCADQNGVANCGGQVDSPWNWQPANRNVLAQSVGGHLCTGAYNTTHGTNTPQVEGALQQLVDSLSGIFFTSFPNLNLISTSAPNNLPAAPVSNPFSPAASFSLDEHCSWNNNIGAAVDTQPIVVGNTTSWVAKYTQPVPNTINDGCDIPFPLWAASSTMPTCSNANPFYGAFVNEELLYPTTNPLTSSTTCASAPCAGALPILRPGPTYLTGISWNFDAQNNIQSVSPTGTYVMYTSDHLCTLGYRNGFSIANDPTAICGGINWQAGHAYSISDIVSPALGNAGFCTFKATTAGTSAAGYGPPACTQGASGCQPIWDAGACTAGSISDGTVVWQRLGDTNLDQPGAQMMRNDVFIMWLVGGGNIPVAVPGPVTTMFAQDSHKEDSPAEHFGARQFGLRW